MGVSLAGRIARAEITGNTFHHNQVGVAIIHSDLADFRDVKISDNMFRENGAAGVLVDASSRADSVRVWIEDNRFISNGRNPDSLTPADDGLHVRGARGATPAVLVAGNFTDRNADYGIEAQEGTVRDGKGNESTGDGCVGVVCTPTRRLP